MARRHRLGPHPDRVLRRLLLLLVLVLIIRRWVLTPTLITGSSMAPTLRSGQLAVVNKLAYRSQPPQRGDIVSVWTGGELWVKRILGLPGEVIEVRRGTVYVDGSPLLEPYVSFRESINIGPGKIEPNQFVAAGDNRQGTWMVVITRQRIVGRVLFLRTRSRERQDAPFAVEHH